MKTEYLSKYTLLPLLMGTILVNLLNASLLEAAANTANIVPKNSRLLGRLETAILQPEAVKVTAKLDTGAYRSAIHAKNITHYMKDNKPWVRFDLPLAGKKYTLERPLIDTTKIKIRAGELAKDGHLHPKIEERPVISLNVCLAGEPAEMEFSLADRSNFSAPMLIGRKAMVRYHLVIDPSQAHLGAKSCQHAGKQS